jgi:hypothetical protein
MLTKKGACLCGAVHILTETMNPNVGACHCSMCRRWAGSPFLGIDCGSDVSFEGAEHITAFSSSDWAERGFCNQCGTHLFYRLKQSNQYFVPSGLFDDSEGFVFDHQIFIDEKPPFYCFANETKNMTGAEFFAQFTAPEV